MITLITGTPGAGKTLYCISKLLRDLVGSVVKNTDNDGNIVEIPRRILTNIPRLLLDHELIGPDAGGGLADWHLWCKPGDVIVYDEVQRSWPPRPNGSKVPDWISALETHRHMGVDFIILTQHPMLLDRNVLALVGRHLHIRRLGGVGMAIVYEWDHCSRSLMYSKALKKSPFKYDKSVFKLYQSSELHTKPKVSIPPLVFVILLALIAAVILVPTLIGRIKDKQNQAVPVSQVKSAQAVPVSSPSSVASKAGGASPVGPAAGQSAVRSYDRMAFVPVVSYDARSAPLYDGLRNVVSMPRIVGRICLDDSCRCITQQGTSVDQAACDEWADMRTRRFDPFKPDPAVVSDASSVSQPQGLQ